MHFRENHGKLFYCCQTTNWPNRKCNFFQWFNVADNSAPPETATSLTPKSTSTSVSSSKSKSSTSGWLFYENDDDDNSDGDDTNYNWYELLSFPPASTTITTSSTIPKRSLLNSFEPKWHHRSRNNETTNCNNDVDDDSEDTEPMEPSLFCGTNSVNSITTTNTKPFFEKNTDSSDETPPSPPSFPLSLSSQSVGCFLEDTMNSVSGNFVVKKPRVEMNENKERWKKAFGNYDEMIKMILS